MKPSMFIKMGDIKGECEDDQHKGTDGWIDVLSWSWGMSQSANTHMGGGGGQAQASVQDMSVVKFVDKSSPDIQKACLAGTHLASATLECTKATGGDSPHMVYIKIVMTDVIISSVSTGGSGGEDRMTENVSLNFAKVEYEYTPQTDAGGKGTAGKSIWNIRQGKPG